MPSDRNVLQHIDDFVNGIFDSTVVTALELGHFIIKIVGIENIILNDNTKQDEAIEQTQVFFQAIKLIVSNEKVKKEAFELLKQDFQERPLYYLGSIVGPGAVMSLIKNQHKKLFIFGVNKTQQAFNLSNDTLYPYYKNIQESFAPLCLIDNKNSNLLKEFNFDDFSCSFYSNSIFNQSLKHLNLMQDEKDYINEYKMFLEKLKQFSQKYNHYKIMPIQLINNLKIAYIQKLSLEDINNININSKLHLLKALYLCEDYVLFDKNKQALFNEEKIKELDFNSSFYIIFSLHKDKITDTYLKARKRLYKSIDTFKKLGFKDLENAYEVYIQSLMAKEEAKKDEAINKNENFSISLNNAKIQNNIIFKGKKTCLKHQKEFLL